MEVREALCSAYAYKRYHDLIANQLKNVADANMADPNVSDHQCDRG